jgi:transcription factor C subunit 6
MAGYDSGDNDPAPPEAVSSSSSSKKDQGIEGDEVVDPVTDGDEPFNLDGMDLPPPIKLRTTSTMPKKAKAKVMVSSARKPSISGPSLSRTSKRQQYVLPTPSVHHRHRAVPLYSRAGRVERLASRPSLFRASDVVMTNNFTHNAKVTDRVNKSWGYNVGSGPLSDLVEDRGWYKEAVEGVPDMDTEANRRPRVYRNVSVKDGWEVLNETYA